MNIYDATIRLKGDTAHEVNKAGLTATEIMVLRRIHGLDAVVRIIPVPPTPDQLTMSNRAERDRLRKLYCDREETAMLVNELFGPDHVPLPTTLDEDEEVVAEIAARDRELKDTNTTTVTQEQLEAMIEKALQERLAEMPAAPGGGQDLPAEPGSPTALAEGPVDPDAPDPATGRLPDHVIARNHAKAVAASQEAAAKRRVEKSAKAMAA